MTARSVPQRHWRSYGTEPLPTGREALEEPVPVVIRVDQSATGGESTRLRLPGHQIGDCAFRELPSMPIEAYI
jgi:hypothetical protein